MAKEHLVREVFTYSQEEQRTFPYIRSYMERIGPQVEAVLADPEATARFMLAGLFLTYRACNHQGIEMTTEDAKLALPAQHIERLRAYKEITGHSIVSKRAYLDTVGLSIISLILPGLGRRLYRFVMHGRARHHTAK